MSGNQLKALGSLVMVRRRQGEAFEAALKNARGVLTEAEAALLQAREEETQTVEEHRQAVETHRDLQLSAFTPHALRILDFRIDAAKARVGEAGRAVEAGGSAVEFQQRQVAQCQAAVRRNQSRIENFEEQMAAIRQEKDRVAEEAAEEESEEAAVSRFVARRRAPAEETGT